MVERIKNKKGFTIIEIMVVIALIGILAAVLVPKFGGVRDTAKNAGMLTNAKMVEAYVASIIDEYEVGKAIGSTAGTDDLIEAIVKHFTSNPLKNPYTGTEVAGNVSVSTTEGTGYRATPSTLVPADAGKVFVEIDDTGKVEVFINGFDADGNEIKNTQRTISQ